MKGKEGLTWPDLGQAVEKQERGIIFNLHYVNVNETLYVPCKKFLY